MYIGIDFGSSFVKAALIDNGVKKTIKKRTVRATTDRQYKYEYDVGDMLGFAKKSIDEFSRIEKIDGIILSTQMHGFILEKNGIATNYISWQDERSLQTDESGLNTLERLKMSVPSELIHLGGVNFKCELSLCGAVSYFRETDDNPFEYVFYTLGSYIISKLTGKNVTHITNAAPTGMYNIYDKCWNLPLIEAAGLFGMTFPAVLDSVRVCGFYNGIPVYPDIGDQQATVLGCGFKENELNINLGTASQMSKICGSEKLRDGSVSEIRPYFNGKYLRVISKLPGGRSLQVIADFFAQTVETFTGVRLEGSEIWNIMDGIPDEESSLAVSLGFFRSLLFNCGEITGIESDNLTVKDIVNAAYDNMAQTFLKVMSEYGTEFIPNVRLCGKFGPRLVKSLERIDRKRSFYAVNVDEAVFAGLENILMCSVSEGTF